MPKPRSTTVDSIVEHGETQRMGVEHGFRWTCFPTCGATGPWVVPSSGWIATGKRVDGAPRSLLSQLVTDWEKHLTEAHPDADLTYDEWAED